MKRVVAVMMILLGLFVAAPTVYAESASSDIIVLVGTTIDLEISTSDVVIEDIQPGMFVSGNEITLSIWTNDGGGYVLYVSAGDGEEYTSSSLEHETALSTFDALPTGNYTESTFPDSTWGASIDSGSTYFGIPYTMDGEKVIDSYTTAGSRDINFLTSVKAGFDVVEGTYHNVLIFTAVPRTEVNQYNLPTE